MFIILLYMFIIYKKKIKIRIMIIFLYGHVPFIKGVTELVPVKKKIIL